MFKHAAIVAVAVLVALAAARGLTAFAAPHLAPPAAVAAVAIPAPAVEPETTSQPAQVSKSSDGHFWAQADVNGRWVKFLVDTGASAVALTGADAQRLGLNLDNLVYERPVMTANGATKAALVKLDHVTVAGAQVRDVDALVVRDGLSTSLLGMSYLGRLSRFEATRTALILRP